LQQGIIVRQFRKKPSRKNTVFGITEVPHSPELPAGYLRLLALRTYIQVAFKMPPSGTKAAENMFFGFSGRLAGL
jgi:hypothetical protein